MMYRWMTCLAVILAAGCSTRVHDYRPQPTPVAAPEPIERDDPEMIELMALLGRATPPAGKPTMSAVSNISQHSFQTVGRDTDPDVDPSGKLMIFSSTSHSRWPDLYLKSVDGKTLTQITTDPASDIQPDFSPDGKHVAFASNRSGTWEIYVLSLDGRTTQQVTRGGGDNVHPSWSPDGTKLVYSCRSARNGDWEMWVIDMNRPSVRNFIGYGLFPAWSPTEDVIAYQRPRGRDDNLYGIWTIRLEEGEPSLPTLVANAPDTAYIGPSFSRDGRQLAFAAISPKDPGGPCDLYIVDLNGENMQRVTQGPGMKFGPIWYDRKIYFSCSRDGQENIWSVEVDTGAPMVAMSNSN